MKKIFLIFLSVILLLLPATSVFAQASFDELMKDKIYTEKYLLCSLDDGTVILGKKINEKVPCPCLNKIVTVALTLKNVKNTDETVTVTQQMLDRVEPYSLSMKLKLGEKISVISLLYAIMLYGANDACEAVAVRVSGSSDAFVNEMNAYVQALGCKNTVFKNCTGFDRDGQYTTAEDIVKIMTDVVKIPLFNEIFGSSAYTVPATNKSQSRAYISGNRMQFSTSVYYSPYVTGGKAGATDKAGYCMISTATKDGYTYLCVVNGAESKDVGGVTTNYAMKDSKQLYKWVFENIKFKVVATKNQIVSVADVIAGSESDHVSLVPAKEVSTLVPKLVDSDGVLIEPIEETVPKKLYAPVKKGDAVCQARILYAGQEIARVGLVAAETVNLSVPRLVLEKIKDVLTSKIFIAVFILLVALIAIYIIFVIADHMKAKRNRMHIVGRK